MPSIGLVIHEIGFEKQVSKDNYTVYPHKLFKQNSYCI